MIPVVVDLSHYNGAIDFGKLKNAGIQAVILKATQGYSIVDSVFTTNAIAANLAGLKIGAYHYGTADDANLQAQHFLNTINSVPVKSILPVLDFERGTSNMTLQSAKAWLNLVSAKMSVVPVLYTGEYLKSFGNQTTLSGYPLWLSEYGPVAKLPFGWSAWTLWQFTNGIVGPLPHTIDGVNGQVDLSYFNGTNDELVAFWATHSS